MGRDVPDDRHVMRDEDIGDAEPRAQVAEKIEHLRLDREVERRDGLVADDQLRLDRKRPGNGDALALAAGEFMGVAIRRGRRQPNHRQQFGHPVRNCIRRAQPVQRNRLTDRPPDAHARIERSEGVLEDDLHAPAHAPQIGLAESTQVDAVEGDRALVRLDEPKQHAADRGLARAAFPDEREDIAARQGEADVRYHAGKLRAGEVTGPVGLAEAGDTEQGRHSTCSSSGARQQAT